MSQVLEYHEPPPRPCCPQCGSREVSFLDRAGADEVAHLVTEDPGGRKLCEECAHAWS